MGWELNNDDGASVNLSHPKGCIIHATKRLEREAWTDSEIEVIHRGESVSRKTHEIEGEEHLWEALDQYTDVYPQ